MPADSVVAFAVACIVNSIVGSFRDGFLQISCPISSRRRACFTNLSQYERGLRRTVCGIMRRLYKHQAFATPSAVEDFIQQNRWITTGEIASHHPQKLV
ncbi:hypothetical protein CEXT_89171 [Caerostris extrusa]|uniref:Uncharacterized protein n=1 Tax=Caerostris extrusa TaxID=172846 RepID=A0AAV4T087_CAEEX|nr:hypothetical protein CEXT_89171 [Caerostris extrusa]